MKFITEPGNLLSPTFSQLQVVSLGSFLHYILISWLESLDAKQINIAVTNYWHGVSFTMNTVIDSMALRLLEQQQDKALHDNGSDTIVQTYIK